MHPFLRTYCVVTAMRRQILRQKTPVAAGPRRSRWLAGAVRCAASLLRTTCPFRRSRLLTYEGVVITFDQEKQGVRLFPTPLPNPTACCLGCRRSNRCGFAMTLARQRGPSRCSTVRRLLHAGTVRHDRFPVERIEVVFRSRERGFSGGYCLSTKRERDDFRTFVQ